MEWRRQGPALVASVTLLDGQWGKVVLVSSRDNPRGAMLVMSADAAGKVSTFPILDCLESLHPRDITEVLCMQERAYGTSGLTPPDIV